MKRIVLMIFLLVSILLLVVISVYGHDDPPPVPDETADVSSYAFDEPLTYYEHIKPIMDANCMGCHAEGQIASDVALYDLDVVRDEADYIADTILIRYMPPWMPGPETIPLQHERKLTDEEIAMLVTWLESGAPLGDPEDETPAVEPELPTIRRDMQFTLEEPYLADGTNNDDYRCFMFDLQLDEPIYVTGYVFEPDELEMVHHGIIYRVDEGARRRALRKNGEDGQPGWSCYNTTHLGDSNEEMIGTWTPGTFTAPYPDGTGYKIEPGQFLVMQVHYNTRITRVLDNTGFYLQVADEQEDIHPLMTVQLMAPVEIPCPDGVEGQRCDRSWSITETAARYGVEFRTRPNELLSGCGMMRADLEKIDPAHATTSCDYPIWWNLTALGVLGHMHELGHSIRIEINPDRDNSIVLLDIPRWDFHWQDRYQFAEPVQVKPGDNVRLTCTWDNTLSENPRYVVWGEGTEDEMCFATVMVLDPRG